MRVDHPTLPAFAESVNKREIKVTIYENDDYRSEIFTKKMMLKVIEVIINTRNTNHISLKNFEYEWVYPLLKG